MRDARTSAVLDCAIEVQRQLGCGFHEVVYQEALALELTEKGVPFRREVEISVKYKGQTLESTWQADFIVYDEVILELKAVSTLVEAHEAQILHYMKAAGLSTGLLLNFGQIRLQIKRMILTPPSAPPAPSADKIAG